MSEKPTNPKAAPARPPAPPQTVKPAAPVASSAPAPAPAPGPPAKPPAPAVAAPLASAPTGAPPAPPPPSPNGGKRRRAGFEPVALEPSIGRRVGAARIGIYGPGGVGKTTAAAYLPNPYIFDLEHGTEEFPSTTRDICRSWRELRGKLASFAAKPDPAVRSVVIDGATSAESFAKDYILETRPQMRNGREHWPDQMEEYDFQRGWGLLFDEMRGLFADLDRIADRGVNVCMIAHDVTSVVPHPGQGEYIRWEPHLHPGSSKGKDNIRSAFKNWCTHLVCITFDISVDSKTGLAAGGSRSLQTMERPFCMGKSRSKQLADYPFRADDPGAVWRELGIE